MSSTSGLTESQIEQQDLNSVNFTGGFPTSKDFAPSIVFLVLYAITTPILIWRLVRRQDRTVVLIRPTIFVGMRFAMLIIRAIEAKQNKFVLGLLIAELVLVSIGFLFLIDPVIQLWKRHVGSVMPKNQQPQWVQKLALVLLLALLAAIGTAAAGGGLTSQAFDSQAGINKVKSLREASYCISLAVVVILLFAIVSTHYRFGLDSRRTLYILIPGLSLLIVAVYRVAQVFSTNPNSAARQLATFWVLQIFFEFVAFCSLIAISIPTWFPSEKKQELTDAEKANGPNRDGAYNQGVGNNMTGLNGNGGRMSEQTVVDRR